MSNEESRMCENCNEKEVCDDDGTPFGCVNNEGIVCGIWKPLGSQTCDNCGIKGTVGACGHVPHHCCWWKPGGVLLKPRTSDQLRRLFHELVKDAKEVFGEDPLVELVYNTETFDPDDKECDIDLVDTKKGFERAFLRAFVILDKEVTEPSKYVTLTTTNERSLETGILEVEVRVIAELVRHYEQPDEDFKPDLEPWWSYGLSDYTLKDLRTGETRPVIGDYPKAADGIGNETLEALRYIRDLEAEIKAIKRKLYDSNVPTQGIARQPAS